MCVIKTGVFKGFEYACFILDKFVTISCMVRRNLGKKIYFFQKNSLEKVVKNDIGESIINMLRKCLEEVKPVQEAIHNNPSS